MTKKKLLPIWAAISAVLIIAGIVLMAVLGFNTALDQPEHKTFDVYYNVVVDLNEESKASLEAHCEDVFSAAGISYSDQVTLNGQSDPASLTGTSFSETGNDFLLRYTFSADTADSALAAAKTALESAIAADSAFATPAEIYVSYATVTQQPMNEAIWRGAVAIVVAVIVALIYVAIRFGVGSALTGLVACVNDAFLVLAILAIARIPVYAFAPMLYAAIAAVVSVAFWLVRCIRLRDDAKDPANSALSAEEAVDKAVAATNKTVLLTALIVAVLLIVCAACTFTTGAMLIFAEALLCVLVPLYFSMLIAPALHGKVKTVFDRMKAKRTRYTGKKKSAKADSEN